MIIVVAVTEWLLCLVHHEVLDEFNYLISPRLKVNERIPLRKGRKRRMEISMIFDDLLLLQPIAVMEALSQLGVEDGKHEEEPKQWKKSNLVANPTFFKQFRAVVNMDTALILYSLNSSS
jgi:hypothetical protein